MSVMSYGLKNKSEYMQCYGKIFPKQQKQNKPRQVSNKLLSLDVLWLKQSYSAHQLPVSDCFIKILINTEVLNKDLPSVF